MTEMEKVFCRNRSRRTSFIGVSVLVRAATDGDRLAAKLRGRRPRQLQRRSTIPTWHLKHE